MDEEKVYILSARDAMLEFMHEINHDADTAPCVVMGAICALMIFMQQTTEETEVAGALIKANYFFTETSKQLLATLPQPSEGAVVYRGPAGSA